MGRWDEHGPMFGGSNQFGKGLTFGSDCDPSEEVSSASQGGGTDDGRTLCYLQNHAGDCPRDEPVCHGGRCTRCNHRHRHARQGGGREGVSRQAALLALRGAQFPDAAVLRRHAHSHFVFDGRGRVRRSARPEGRLSLRQGRGGHRFQRTACQAFATAGFPGGDRPLGRHGLFPATDGRRSCPAGDAAGTEMVRRDQFRQRRAGRRRYHHQLRQGPDAERLPDPGHARLSQRLARDHQGGG